MRLKPEFIIHRTKTETILVPVGGSSFSGIVKGNATLGEILSLLEKDTTEQELLVAMLDSFDAPTEIIRRDVQEALNELRKIGALDE